MKDSALTESGCVSPQRDRPSGALWGDAADRKPKPPIHPKGPALEILLFFFVFVLLVVLRRGPAQARDPALHAAHQGLPIVRPLLLFLIVLLSFLSFSPKKKKKSDETARNYKDLGTAIAAIVGNKEAKTFQIYVYQSKTAVICSSPISTKFQFVVCVFFSALLLITS